MYWHGGWGFGFFPFFLIGPLFWLLIIFLVFRRGPRSYRHWHSEPSPEEILSERFAKGEIDEDEYKKRMDVLKKHAK